MLVCYNVTVILYTGRPFVSKMIQQSYAKLNDLKPGKIVAEGWLREQLLRNRDGMGGHLDELEPQMIAMPYVTSETVEDEASGWGKKKKAGWGAEISGNYWRGEIALAFALDDPWLKEKAEKWVNAVISRQRDDGYLGTYTEDDDFFDDYNSWGTACGMSALLTYYQATGREDVLNAVHRCMLWFCDNWTGDRKTCYAGVFIVHTMTMCYRYVKDERLLQFCEDYFDFLDRNDLFGKSISALSSPVLNYGSDHGAGYGISLSLAAELYAVCGKKKYLDASVNGFAKLAGKCLQKTGGITCDCEYLSPLGMVVETEYCAVTTLNASLFELLRITGNSLYADNMERVCFNAAEGGRKKDEKAIAYFTTPNQIFATNISSQTAKYPHQAYAPCHRVSCCPVMSVRVLPEFVNGIAFTDNDGNPYVCNYAPCSIDFDAFKLKTETRYPFRDRIDFAVTAEKDFDTTFFFRRPEWCSAPEIYVNGKATEVKVNSDNYMEVKGSFKNGDVISLVFPMSVKVDYLDDKDRSRLFPLCFEYGPLLFSLPIEENWQAWPGEPYTPLPEGWHWYNIMPVVKTRPMDHFDEKGIRRYMIDYNVAVDENIKAEDVKVELCGDEEAYPWENVQVKLTLDAYKAPWSYATYPYRSMEPYCEGGKSIVTEKMKISLVPYGNTCLRITYFPRAALETK